MYPRVRASFDLKPQRLQSSPFVCKISKSYLERNVVNGGSCCVRSTIAGALGAVKQCEHLGVTVVAVCNFEERAVRNPRCHRPSHRIRSLRSPLPASPSNVPCPCREQEWRRAGTM